MIEKPRSDEQEAIDTYNRMYEGTCGLSTITELACAVIVARAIRSASYRPNVVGYREDDE